jgi:low temperature requirement protein LtrA
MVAAASSMADNLKEDQTWQGVVEFTTLYMVMVKGWLLYTHHYTSRFEESSLLHTFVLFFFLLGMASSNVNAGYDTARMFSLSVVLQRVALLCMLVPIMFCLERARYFCAVYSSVVAGSTLLFFVAAILPDRAPILWAVIACSEHFLEFWVPHFIPGDKLVPVNIDHTQDRLGVLVMVMLGETVISATITYRELDHHSNAGDGSRYYVVLMLSFLLIFMFMQLFFNAQPAPKDSALRRSRTLGSILVILNKTLGLTLLLIGVSIKIAVEAVTEGEDLNRFAAHLLCIGVGFSMLIILGMRACHYGGKLPRPTDPPYVQRLMVIWWILVGVVSFVPFLFIGFRDPVVALAMQSGLLVILLSLKLGSRMFSMTL